MTESRRHHHRHHQKDASEIFKEKQLGARRRRKVCSDVLFALGCVLALLIILAVFWLYTNE